VLVDWAEKDDLLKVNPMGKVPTIVHHHGGHHHVVTEAAAICHYLAEMNAPDLLPRELEKADYFRWLFFAAGPVEQATTSKMFGWEVPAEREMAVGFGSYERTMDALDGWLASHDYVCGDRFTMADVYVGSQVDWGLMFKSFPERPSFAAYAERIRARPAYQAGKAIDNALIAEMQAAQPA
jgi:glutathione S-transferase